MSSFSSRELRENPAALIRELEAGQSPVITVRGKPVGVVVPFDAVLEGGARLGLAAGLLGAGAVSLGTAARIADRSIEEMLELLGRLGMTDLFGEVEELGADLDRAERP